MALLGLTAIASPAAAEEGPGQVLQELYLAEPAYLQERGEAQLTLRADALRAPDTTSATGSAALEYGVSSNLQIEAALPYLVLVEPQQTDHGAGRASVGALGGGALGEQLLVAAGAEVSFPSLSTLDEDQFGVEPSLSLQTALGDVHALIGEGAFAIVSKPFPMDQLFRVVERACRGPVVVVVDDASEAAALADELRQHFVAAVACEDVGCALRRKGADVFVTATPLVSREFLDELKRRSDDGEPVTLVFVTDHPAQRVPPTPLRGFVVKRPPKVPWLLKTIADARGVH